MIEHKPGCNYNDSDPCSCGASIAEQCHNTMTSRKCIGCEISECPLTEQPNTNAMIFEQVNGCCEMITNLLEQLIPKTTHVVDCAITLKSWQDNNLKHLQRAYK